APASDTLRPRPPRREPPCSSPRRSPHGGVPSEGGQGRNCPRAGAQALVRDWTVRSQEANRRAGVSPSAPGTGWPSPAVIHRAKGASTSIRATVAHADPQVVLLCWRGPGTPGTSRKGGLTPPSSQRQADRLCLRLLLLSCRTIVGRTLCRTTSS